jgi:hypothetical protein
MNEEKRSIDIETENENPCIMHVQFACGFASMAQKLYFNAVVEPEMRAVLEKHKKNLIELAYA